MKAKLPIIKSLISVAFLAVFLVVALMVNFETFAWFASSTEVSANNLSVILDGEESIVSIRYFRPTGTIIKEVDGVKRNTYKFGYSESVLDTQYKEGTKEKERSSFETPVGMLPYSDLAGDCQILIEVTVRSEGAVSLKLDIPSGTEYLGNIISNKRTNKNYDLTPNDLPFSSVCRFAVFNNLSVLENAFIVDEEDIINQGYSFVNENNKVFTFNNIQAFSNGLTVNPVNKMFYIVFDYNQTLVEYINEQILYYVDEAQYEEVEIPIEIGTTNLKFVPDFKFILSEVGVIV